MKVFGASARVIASLRSAWLLWPALALAAIVSAQQVAEAVRNSPTASTFLKAHADEIGALAIHVESGGDTTAYNGSCCYGVLQLNVTNILAAGYSISQYRNASLQVQVDGWSLIQSQALADPVIQTLESMASFDGQPVDAALLLACVQLGQGNCRTMVQSGSCGGFKDANGTTICQMAAAMRAAINGVVVQPGGGPSSAGGGSYAPGSVGASPAPDAAFGSAAGVGMAQAADAIKLIGGALVLLWLTWASKAAWQRFVNGGADVRSMIGAVVRAAGVALVALYALT
jgi:hypothetical protein